MKKKSKVTMLLILIIIITFITIRQSIQLHKGFKKIAIPNKESRQLGNMSIYEWLTVKKISNKYNISEQKIFKTLEITPHSGDENISIVDLTKKYNKTPEQMKKNLKKIIKNLKDSEGRKHE